MFIKLGIAAAIVIVALAAFSSEIGEYFPNATSTGVDSLKQDISSIAASSIESAERRIDSAAGQIGGELTDLAGSSVESVGQDIAEKLGSLPGSQAP